MSYRGKKPSVLIIFIYSVGERPAATHAAIQTPWAALHARIAAGTAAPPVETPATPPAADTQATQTPLHPVWQIP